MSSTKDKIRDWFFALPEETRNQIDDQIERIRNQEDVTERHQQTLTKMVKELARILEPLIDDLTQISVIIKAIANGRISDGTIEQALPEDKKRKHKPYERYQDTEIVDSDFSRSVTVSSSGSQSVTGPEGNAKEEEIEIGRASEDDIQTTNFVYGSRSQSQDTDRRDEIAERSAEIALSTIDILKKEIHDKEIRLNEAFKMIEDKDHEIERQRLNMGEMEIRIRDLEKQPTEDITELQARYDELKAIEAERTKQHDFVPASKVQSPKPVWVAAINALNFYRELNKASKYAIEHNDPWKKLLFDIAGDGQLTVARLEGS